MAITRDDVRRLALEEPHAVEMIHRRSPSFRVNLRIFCMMPEGADWVTLKLDREDQLNMIEGHPGVVTPARLYAHHGWTYLRLEPADEHLARTLLHLAWTHVAPKHMVKASRLAM
jgi:hypothetical protein